MDRITDKRWQTVAFELINKGKRMDKLEIFSNASILDAFLRAKEDLIPGVMNIPLIITAKVDPKRPLSAVTWRPAGSTATTRQLHGEIKIPSDLTPSFEFAYSKLRVSAINSIRRQVTWNADYIDSTASTFT